MQNKNQKYFYSKKKEFPSIEEVGYGTLQFKYKIVV